LDRVQHPCGEVVPPLLLQPLGRSAVAGEDEEPKEEEAQGVEHPQRGPDGRPGNVDVLVGLRGRRKGGKEGGRMRVWIVEDERFWS
jgi:hypothetical protein